MIRPSEHWSSICKVNWNEWWCLPCKQCYAGFLSNNVIVQAFSTKETVKENLISMSNLVWGWNFRYLEIIEHKSCPFVSQTTCFHACNAIQLSWENSVHTSWLIHKIFDAKEKLIQEIVVTKRGIMLPLKQTWYWEFVSVYLSHKVVSTLPAGPKRTLKLTLESCCAWLPVVYYVNIIFIRN